MLVRVVFERTERNTEGRLFPVLFNNFFEILSEILPEKTSNSRTGQEQVSLIGQFSETRKKDPDTSIFT